MRTLSLFAVIFSTFIFATAQAADPTPTPTPRRSGLTILRGDDDQHARSTPAPRGPSRANVPVVDANVDEYSRAVAEAIANERRKNGGLAGYGAFNTTYTWSISEKNPDGSRKTNEQIAKERATANTVPERAFGHNTTRSRYSSHVNSGKDLLEDMAKYSYEHGCISDFTIAVHGWDEAPYPNGGEGVPMVTNYAGAGLYLDDATREANHGPYQPGAEKAGRTLADLTKPQTFVVGQTGNERHQTSNIVFCSPCHIQIMGCNTGAKFAQEFSRISKCEVVYATGRVSVDDTNDGSGDFNWNGDPANGNMRDGSFYKFTPVKTASGGVTMVQTKLGRKYKAQ